MKFLYFSILACLFLSCSQNINDSKPIDYDKNEAAEGFDVANSDPKAVEIADKVMEAMGGRKNWDDTRYIHWTFFGRRTLIWDKKIGDVQIVIPSDSQQIFLNIFDDSIGKLEQNGVAVMEKDSIQKYVEKGESIWINDSYWLVMPFKLKDSGVTLKYNGEGQLATGEAAEILQLTFKEVGNTPQNKYLVYVTPTDHLIKQWDFYRNADDPVIAFSTPWTDYQQKGNILLSGNRGQYQLSNIEVYEELPEGFKWLK